MAATVTFRTAPPKTTADQAVQIVWGSIALSGSYPGTTGDTVNLGGSKSPVQSNKVPIFVNLSELPVSGVTAPSGYILYYQNGTNPTNGALRITSSAGTEISAGSYPAALTSTNIVFEAAFPLGQ